MPLDPEQQAYLTTAEGYIGLGMYLEADAELDNVDPFCFIPTSQNRKVKCGVGFRRPRSISEIIPRESPDFSARRVFDMPIRSRSSRKEAITFACI